MLVNNGEVCGTEIIADNILKQELIKAVDFSDMKQTVAFLENIIRAAHNTAKTSGLLMFVEVNKGYYSSVANEKLDQ